jgi:hypothetical protein
VLKLNISITFSKLVYLSTSSQLIMLCIRIFPVCSLTCNINDQIYNLVSNCSYLHRCTYVNIFFYFNFKYFLYYFLFSSQLQVEGLTKSQSSPSLTTSLRDDTSMGWIQWEYIALLICICKSMCKALLRPN